MKYKLKAGEHIIKLKDIHQKLACLDFWPIAKRWCQFFVFYIIIGRWTLRPTVKQYAQKAILMEKQFGYKR
jgi:hypothetical protein